MKSKRKKLIQSLDEFFLKLKELKGEGAWQNHFAAHPLSG